MKQYEVKITNKALADMEAIYDYIADHFQAPDTAMKQYGRIAEGIQSLEVFPERCRRFESKPERDMGLRQLLVDNYSVIYVIEEDAVIVLRILYSASDIIARLRNDMI